MEALAQEQPVASKACGKCKVEKPLEMFSKAKDGLQGYCKVCSNATYALYYEAHKEQLAASDKVYYEAHKEQKAERAKLYREGHKEQRAANGKRYRENHKEEVAAYNNSYHKQRKLTDLQFKLKVNLRTRLYMALKGNAKAGSAVRDLGCSMEAFRLYLESHFQPGMTWENWGIKGWHIDHIKPLSSFDLTDRAQFLIACHYTNLQPLWAKDNLSKSDKVDWTKEEPNGDL